MGACTGRQKPKQDPNKLLMPYKVCFAAYIWNKNTHNLFDFEGNQSVKKEIEVDFSSCIAAVDKDLVALMDNENFKNQQELLRLECDPQHIQLNVISQNQDHRLWAIVRNPNPQSDFESLNHWDLSQNDIVKMGRVRVQLMEFKFVSDEQAQIDQVKPIQESDLISEDYGNGEEVTQCRICFSRHSTIVNPLMSPCKCTGSVKYVHLQCLQSWIGVQIKVKKSETSTMYMWKRMQCEICKSHFKSTYSFQGNNYSIMAIPRPTGSYMMLNITNDEKGKDGMIIMLEIAGKTELKIGRVPECDIKLKDISVSRQHAIIKLLPAENSTPQNPNYTMRLVDNYSKFGTLVLAQGNKLRSLSVPECYDMPRILFQIGRVLVHMSIKLKTNKSSTYKHPSSLMSAGNNPPVIEQESPAKLNILDCSLQTNNELNLSDIIINEHQMQQEEEEEAELRQLSDQGAAQNQIGLFEFDNSVGDEHQ